MFLLQSFLIIYVCCASLETISAPAVAAAAGSATAATSGMDSNSRQFSPPLSSGNDLLRFVYSPSLNSFFVGGVNGLYQVDVRHLSLVHSVVTGPRLDSPSCHASGCSGTAEQEKRVLQNNTNKILLLDSENEKLLACGSLFQGACTKYPLTDISSEKDTEFVSEPVAANDEASSTFAFIGPQRYNRWGHGNVVYVGTTFTSAGDYRHDVPAIASRNLHDLKFAEYSFSKQSLLRIDVKYRDRFLVQYIYGFNTSNHIYFAIIQKRSHVAGQDDKGFVTRLARVCISDPNFDTYSEVTIQCDDEDGETYGMLRAAKFLPGKRTNDSVLIASFSRTADPNYKSVVCRFAMSTVERLFQENIHNCFNGSMTLRNMEYISGPVQEGKCPVVGKSGNIANFCQVGLKISGVSPIVSSAVFATQNGQVTAVDAMTTQDGVQVVVLGMTSGQIVILKLDRSDTPRNLGSFWKDDGILQLEIIGEDVYYLHKRGLGRVAIASSCHQHLDCPACANSGNPLCGWCSATNKCTTRTTCPGGEGGGGGRGDNILFQAASKRCTSLQSVEPPQLDTAKSKELVKLNIKDLPRLLNEHHSYICQFSGSLRYRARVIPGGVLCPNPIGNLSLPQEEPLPLELIINTGITESVLLTTSLSVFDCQRQSRCDTCTQYSNCLWCSNNAQCYPASASDMSGGGCAGGNLKRSCPKMITLPEVEKIPDSVPTRLQFPFLQLSHAYYKAKFYCLVSVEEAKMKIAANLYNNSIIVCDRTTFKYVAEEKEMPITISVILEGGEILGTTRVYLYKCSYVGRHNGMEDCSLCLSHQKDYRCAWCGGNTCQFHSTCGEKRPIEVCPNPKIFIVEPSSGPIEGGTKLTVDGSNLISPTGKIRPRIFVGDTVCAGLEKREEDDAADLRCSAPPSPGRRAENVSISIALSTGRRIPSGLVFQYKNFNVLGARPSKGPRSGGTKLEIFGSNLEIGSRRKIFLNDVPCLVEDKDFVTDRGVVCTLSSVERPRLTNRLTVHIDAAVRTTKFEYEFLPDPIVTQIKPLESFRSGGRIISVHGEHFHTVPGVTLTLLVSDSIRKYSTCTVISDHLMECPTPKVPASLNFPLYLDAALTATNTSGHLDLKSIDSSLKSQLLYVADPLYFNFTNGYKRYSDGDPLVIEGRRLREASTLEDIQIYVGKVECNITALTNRQLICVLPLDRPKEDKPPVQVKVGSLSFSVGHIQYGALFQNEIPSEVVGGIGASAAILIFLAVVGLIILKHKSSEAEREYKRIQIQMDILENNVRSECKLAFAELQTDMTDLTMELEVTGIPVVSEKSFLMNIFFPGVVNHPILIVPTEVKRVNSPIGQLEQLLLNKTFFVALVNALDNQVHINIRDKVNFASLLSVVMLPRLDYYADALKTLLRQLLSFHTKNPELRRTISIMEKLLTNWLAICLYDYTKDHIGPPLFFLYKAIKCQVEKGPVDMFTLESRYSLSENGLLRNNCDYYTITCLVLQRELDEAYETKVISCDSISQVKGKILDSVYKNTPFSLRPSVEEIDLEWQCGEAAHVVLQDVDLTTKCCSDGSTKVNTLEHYGIKNKAVVSLVPKQYGKQNSLVKNSSSGDGMLRHLDSNADQSTNMASRKTVPEVFLTRLLSTKGTLKKFIDDSFQSVLTVENRFPCTIKWLFDLFDEFEKDNLKESDDIIHQWKANSVFVRFWISLLKNPDLLYDIERTEATDENLAVIAQALSCACNGSEMSMTKESPTHKLLFAKEISERNTQLYTFFKDVRNLPTVPEQEFNFYMTQLSQRSRDHFNKEAALNEILIYVCQYYNAILHQLLEENSCVSNDVVNALRDIVSSNYATRVCAE
jgi:plexin A